MPLEKQSLNNFLPNGFETLNQEGYKENFSEDKIATGYEKDVPDIVSGPNLNNLIDVIGKNTNILSKFMDFIKNMPVNNTLKVNSANQLDYEDVSDLNNKVSKSGDIMSGNLTIHDNQYKGVLFLQNKTLDYNNFVKPDNMIQSGILQFTDKNNQYYAYVQHQIVTNGQYNMSMGQRRKINGQDIYCSFESYINEDGLCYCVIPNSPKIDGQWVSKSVLLASNVSCAVGTTILTYSLADYLPKDQYHYEVLISVDAYTGSTKGANFNVTGWGVLGHRICGEQTRSSLATGANGGGTIIIGTDRQIILDVKTEVSPSTLQFFYIEGYRRIGLNN